MSVPTPDRAFGRRKSGVVLGLVLAAGLISSGILSGPSLKEAWLAYRVERATKIMDRTVIPRFQLQAATLTEALAGWAQAGRKAGAPESVIRWKIVPREEDSRPILRWLKIEGEMQADGTLRVVEKALPSGTSPSSRSPSTPGLGAAPGPVSPPESSSGARISVSLSNMPLHEALKYISTLSGYYYVVGVNEICLYASENEPRGPLISRKMKVPAGFVFLGVRPPAAVGGKIDARLFLSESGIQFCEGSRAEYVLADGELQTLLPQDQDDLVQMIFALNVVAPPTFRH